MGFKWIPWFIWVKSPKLTGIKKSCPSSCCNPKSHAKPGRKDISEIAKFQPILGDNKEKVELVRKYIDSKGVSRVAGTKALKGSQNYPLPSLFYV